MYKLKNINVAKIMKFVSEKIENVEEPEENAGYRHYFVSPLATMFS